MAPAYSVPPAIGRWPAVGAGLTASVGALALLGWCLDIELLKSVVPGQVAMKANTAVGLMLAGVALARLSSVDASRGRRRVGRIAAGTAGLLGLATLSQYAHGHSLGIDELLFDEAPGAAGTFDPGRMAPNTAVDFVLISLGLLWLDSPHRRIELVAPIGGLAAAALALLALLGYASSITSFFGVHGVTQMAVPTAVAFMAIGTGLAFARPCRGPMRRLSSDGIGGTVSRRLLPAAIAGPLILAALRLAGENVGLYPHRVGTWLFALTIVGVLVALVWRLAGSLERAERQTLRAGQAVAAAQEHAATFDDAPIGAAIVGLDGRFLRVNRSLCEMVGVPAADLVGASFTQLTVDEEQGCATRLRADLRAGKLRTAQRHRRWVLPDGQMISVLINVTAIADADGQPMHILAQLQDVTDRDRAHRELEQTTIHALERLALAAEFRDDDTGEHMHRVADVAAAVATALRLPEDEVALIRHAAPLHDVGKIGIPDAVLLKPGRLTHEEFEQIKTHTTIGASILGGREHPLLERAEEIALSHHERWDGGGYPHGLAGEEIPMAGRILAVADVYDALTSDRPYKEAWSPEAAIAEIERQRGRQFDPQVVDAFLETIALYPTAPRVDWSPPALEIPTEAHVRSELSARQPYAA